VSLTRSSKKEKIEYKLTEVVGSNPTRSIFVNLGKYGIESGSFWVIVGQNPAAVQIDYAAHISVPVSLRIC
jgi:hypothetical protein